MDTDQMVETSQSSDREISVPTTAQGQAVRKRALAARERCEREFYSLCAIYGYDPARIRGKRRTREIYTQRDIITENFLKRGLG